MGTFLLNSKPETRALLQGCMTAVALVGAVFTLTVLVLLAVNVVHAKLIWPVDAPVLNAMLEELQTGEADEQTAERVRTVDLLMRRAYFFSAEFTARGMLLVLGGLAVILLALQWRGAVARTLPEPGPPAAEADDLAAAGKARAVLAALSGLAALVAVVGFYRFGPLPEPVAASEDAGAQGPESASRVAGRWSGLRGPGGLGIAATTNAPPRWDGVTGENMLWKTALPLPGFSSPVVVQGRVFVTGGRRNQLMVLCIDAGTGAVLRQTAVPSALAPDAWPDIPDETTYAAPTPAVAGDTVVVLFGTGDAAGLDVDGHLIWSRHLGVPESLYGYASSPVADGGRIFVQYDHDADQRLIALDAATGETVWEVQRELMPSWASPAVVVVDGKRQVVVCANPFVAGYDPADGAELWRTEGMGGEPAPSPAYAGGMVYVATDYSVLMAIDLLLPDEPAWTVSEDLPDVSSPLATGERLYIASSMGVVTCFDRFDGTVLWKQEFDDGFYASPILVGGDIYLTDITGNTFVFADADAYEERAVLPLGEACSATAAFLPGRIILRGQSHLFCMGAP